MRIDLRCEKFQFSNCETIRIKCLLFIDLNGPNVLRNRRRWGDFSRAKTAQNFSSHFPMTKTLKQSSEDPTIILNFNQLMWTFSSIIARRSLRIADFNCSRVCLKQWRSVLQWWKEKESKRKETAEKKSRSCHFCGFSWWIEMRRKNRGRNFIEICS